MYKILVVEDDEPSRELLARRLDRSGYTVLLATNGVEAVEMASLTIPDLILMDIHMPLMDGKQAARRIRSLPECSAIPIVAVTASVLNDDIEEALEAGCDDWTAKPVQMQSLLPKMQALLAQAASRASHAPSDLT
jgi:CheY-like chemotaxis protein